MQPLLSIPSLPTDSLPEPWSEVFRRIDRPTPFPALIEPILQWRLDMEEADLRVALYWVLKKKWNSKLKIPLKLKQAKLYKPWGELLFRTLELSERLHKVDHPATQHYVDAADWYLHLMLETKRISNDVIIDNEAGGKTPFVQERYSIIGSLKAQRNPVNPQTSPHFYRLVEVALTLEPQDEFNNRYWKPFLRACSQWTEMTASRLCQETFSEGNKIMQRCGRGRGKIMFFSLP